MTTTQTKIIAALGIVQNFDAAGEATRRIAFLCDYLKNSGRKAYVLGVSGGVDSTTAALLAQAAVQQLRAEGYACDFIPVRLPNGIQADEDDAQEALRVIGAGAGYNVNIKSMADGMMAELERAGVMFLTPFARDFHHGNVKARTRMIAQYAIAGACRGIVIGTDHGAESVMGFYTKFGDGAADILPLAGLNKRMVRQIAKYLGAPDNLVFKVPTADLEELSPQRPDEHAYGLTYDQIDDFLEGKIVGDAATARIIACYDASRHKRAQPVAAIP